eukprot:TRINITY_DN20338_c0_g1_i1.p1 TRINITY_DN20338_c0_g1~~TRINITY_DN20338_c0_g1_i1.p1  ORF type:complete len:390 (-),score=96.72 TRINITY_DN20338_c0_g1_i1:350-1519(-)
MASNGDGVGGSAKRQKRGDAEDPLAGLRTPCYVVDRAVLTANCERMQKRAEALGVVLRPHMKTHKTIQAGEMVTKGTKRRIVVSTLAEANFFRDGGFDDIIYAVPITPDKLPDAAKLTAQLTSFHVLVDHPFQVDALLAHGAPAEGKKWSIVVMVDCGYHRDGVDPEDPDSVELVRRISSSSVASLEGIYTHGGHSYGAKSVDEVVRIGEQERDAVVNFAKKLRAAGISCKTVGVGSTPTCSNPPAHLEGVTEMHPGNFVYYDWMQVRLGSCKPAEVAVRVCTRVIGHYPKQNMLLIDMGWTGISAQGADKGYGAIDGHPELKIQNLKQEAGEVGSADGNKLDFSKYPIGTILRVLPWHSCASSHQHTSVHVLDEAGKPVERWQHVRGW